MISAGRHPKNAINAALAELDPDRFEVVVVHKGHRWGMVRCVGCGDVRAVYSTPRVPEDNARDIRLFASRHQHRQE
ncbi:MAG: hypothetical protein FWF02_03350 [Micrococcales bacterium]|nr:hypothetical protein [Micrococcales bacterium]MCL2666724.1 hypothetical protein [Micrococcales bacterium]